MAISHRNDQMVQQLTIEVTECLMSIIVELNSATIALKLGKKILEKISLKDTDLLCK